jgi:hypothetical protein
VAINPVQLFIQSANNDERILTALNGRELNKSTLAEIANVGYSIVHRTDLALYDTMPPKLHSFMTRVDKDTLWGIKYVAYKKEMLEERKRLLTPRMWLKVPTRKYDSWIEFREIVADTQMEFAKLFLINPAILQHYEAGSTKFLPVVIKKRLEYFGMPPENIAYLAELPVGERTIFDGE